MEKIEFRTCIRCGKSKPIDKYYIRYHKKHKKEEIETRCKTCVQELSSIWYKENFERIRKRREENPESYESNKARTLKYYYGISLEQYKQMLKDCDNKCTICNIELDRSTKKLEPHIDHCHRTDKIRGILCGKCNSILGYCDDNTEILKICIKYLEDNV